MNGNRPAAVASLVPLMVEAVEDLTSAPTRVSRRPRQDPTKLERRAAAPARTKIEIDELPTLVVPPPITLSSGARRRPKEIADDVASSFDISPFESFEGDVETIADVDDESREHIAGEASSTAKDHAANAKDESAFAGMLPPMAQVWNQADAIVAEPLFAIDVTTNPDAVELIEAVEDEADEDAIASETRAPHRARWVAAFFVAATACAACAFFVDERVAAQGHALSERAITIAQTEILPELRGIEGRARWIASRSR